MVDEVRCVQQANAILGEGPLWCARDNVLYWLDIKRPAVYRYDPERGQTGHWPLSSEIGCMALRESGGMVAGTSASLAAMWGPSVKKTLCSLARRFQSGSVRCRTCSKAGSVSM